jgi:hypothetical protein
VQRAGQLRAFCTAIVKKLKTKILSIFVQQLKKVLSQG